jgi:hypothetical protein
MYPTRQSARRTELRYLLVVLTGPFVLALYRLLQGVNRQPAILMVLLSLIDAPLAFMGTANEVATLAILRGADFLAVFDRPQRDQPGTLPPA